ncbi:MAG: tetratricopeptide repeat protein [Alphaproteobacteria bacterium]|nr:tetratricopeptide repeat protein [Alphaproteobacteria bacterium]
MSTRSVLLASVCSAFLAASAAVAGSAAAATPASNSKLVSQAYKALQGGDAPAAVTAYSKAIESRALEPEVLANALLNRGLAYQRLDQHDRAIDDYTAALRLDAMSGKLRALALYNRGLSYQKLGMASRGIEDFTSALFLDSQFAHAYFSRGILLREGGQYLFALADFDKAIRFNHPDPARVHYAEAVTFEKLRRPQNARDSLTKALAVNAKYAPALKRLAALNGARIVPAAAPADQIATATIAATAKLPEATAPAPELLATPEPKPKVEEAAVTRKKIDDRVPAEERAVRIASAAPAEKVIAVEEYPVEQDATATAASAPAAEPASDAAPTLTGWSVQVASATSEDAAWSVWKKMKARHQALADKEPVVVRADLGTKGVFYRVRLIGYDNQGDAGSACSKLKSNGVKCFISKANS